MLPKARDKAADQARGCMIPDGVIAYHAQTHFQGKYTVCP